MMPSFESLVRAAALLALLARPADGQVRGIVTDATGARLPAVMVELWKPGARAAVRLTDAAGTFHFTPEQSAGVTGLTATHIGYGTVSVGSGPTDSISSRPCSLRGS